MSWSILTPRRWKQGVCLQPLWDYNLVNKGLDLKSSLENGLEVETKNTVAKAKRSYINSEISNSQIGSTPKDFGKQAKQFYLAF